MSDTNERNVTGDLNEFMAFMWATTAQNNLEFLYKHNLVTYNDWVIINRNIKEDLERKLEVL